MSPEPYLRIISTVALSAVLITAAHADHGPGTSGSGVTTQTAETLRKNQWSASVHLDWSEFEPVDEASLAGLDHFDYLESSHLTSFGISYGLTDNLQVSLGLGYYATDGARQIAHGHHSEPVAARNTSESRPRKARVTTPAVRRRPLHSGHGNHGGGGAVAPPSSPPSDADTPAQEQPTEEDDHEIASFDADGWTDLWLTAKYRIYHGPAGQFALLGGIKFPTGDAEVINSAGLRVERGSAAGTGAWDGMIGAAYTIALTPALSLDASAQFTWRGQKGGFRLGNRFDAGIAAGWRVWGGADDYPHVAVLGEVALRHFERSKERSVKLSDTGATTLFASPGIRVAFSPHVAWTAAFHAPVVQHSNGNQVDTEYHITTSVDLAF